MNIALIIPTYNASSLAHQQLNSIQIQTLSPIKCVIDSSSQDGTVSIYQAAEFVVTVIPKAEFNHGKTRQLALSLVDADVYIYMTQDAILADENALKNIVTVFDNPSVGCAYGRQLPHQDAGILGAHLRHFNYPAESDLRSLQDVPRLGIKTCANSNSFAAYRKSALMQIGGFPERVILGEDVGVAAKMLIAGWKVAYCAEAKAFHSHDYTALQDFRRYFDVGVFHQQEHWILDTFTAPGKLGGQYVKSELRWCIQHKAYGMILVSFWHSGMKWLGYRLGRQYRCLPLWLRKRFSMHRFYWT